MLSKSVKPNYDYLAKRLDAPNSEQLRSRIAELLARIDLNDMVADVKAFLIHPTDEKRIRLFPEIIKQADLG